MQAVILVGGEGTRLRPLTFGTPKPMVPLFDVPFLERTIGRLRDAGVDEVILASGYLPQAIEDHFGDGSRVGVAIRYVVEAEPLGTAGALRNVAHLIGGTFFVLNGDVLTSLDLRAMLASHRAAGGLGTLHLIRVDDPSAFGCVVHDAAGRVSRFVEKPPPGEAPTDEVNAGTYILERSVLDRIPAGRPVSIERETFPELLAGGEVLHAHTTDDYWLDVGRPQQYLQAHDDVLSGALALPAAGDPALAGRMWLAGDATAPANVRPPAFVGAGAALDPAAVVGPYAVVGAGCRVAAGARVERTVLWRRVAVGAGASIDGAIVADDAVVGAGATVEAGSVLGHGAVVDAGSVVGRDARVLGRTGAAVAG